MSLFENVETLCVWLDDSNEVSQHEDSMRVMKIGEEYGEAVAAYIGMVGQNPRKGVTHTLDDLLSELADVALTAMAAIQHFTQDINLTEKAINTKASSVAERLKKFQ